TTSWYLAFHALLAQLFPLADQPISAASWVFPWRPPATPVSASRQRGGVVRRGRRQWATPGVGPAARRRSVALLAQMARPQLPKRLQRLGAVVKEIEPRLRIPLDHHRAALDLVIHPVRGDAQRLRQLRHRQVPYDASRVRLRAMLHKPQLEADALDRAGQDRGSTRRAIPVSGELTGYLVVACTRGKQDPNLLRHFMGRGQVRQGPDRHRDLTRRGLAAAPDNPGVHLIAPGPLDHDLVNETAQYGLALRL